MFLRNARETTIFQSAVSLLCLLIYTSTRNQSLASTTTSTSTTSTTSQSSSSSDEKSLPEVDPDKCLVWGSGLKSDIVLPARYFMIQLVDKSGEK